MTPVLRAAPLILLAACSTHGSIQTAHTVGKGRFQGAIEPGAGVTSVQGVTLAYPQLNFAGRYGITDRFDFGARIGTSLYEVTAKIQFTEAEGTVISLAPSTSYMFIAVDGNGGGYYSLQLPLLIGVPVGEDQVVVGPQLKLYNAFAGGSTSAGSASGSALALIAGGQVAYSAKLGDSFRLHPELSLHVPFYGSIGGGVSTGTTTGTGTGVSGSTSAFGVHSVLVGVNLGLLFGGR